MKWEMGRLSIFAVLLLTAFGVARATTVVCEPQPGPGPDDEGDPPGPYGYHTTNAMAYAGTWDYWYEVTPSAGESINSFKIYTGLQYDSDIDLFVGWQCPAGWTNSVIQRPGCPLEVHWYNVSGSPLTGAVATAFGFDHPNDGMWGSWTTDVDSVEAHADLTNGYGCMVHVPSDFKSRPAEVFVATNGANVFPYTNWTMAARDIGTAVRVAAQGGIVHVSNGIYRLTNEIAVGRGMTIEGVNGRDATIVDASDAPSPTRCFSLVTTGIVLRGLTIRGGHPAGHGGGVLCAVLPGYYGIDGCLFESNTAWNGGGLCGDTWQGGVKDCVFRGNRAEWCGGGAYIGSITCISNCQFFGNAASNGNGGALDLYSGVIVGCEVRGNGAHDGGGIWLGGNAAVRNSLIIDNNCASNGGGLAFIAGGDVDSCTVVDNSAGSNGGGIYSWCYSEANTPVGCIFYKEGGHVRNSIVWGNSAPNGANSCHMDFNWVYDHACTSPRPIGNGNIEANPGFASGSCRLSSESPCVNAGTNEDWMAGASDVFGTARITWNVADIGADEFDSDELACNFDVARSSGVSPMTNVLSALVQGANRTDLFFRWDLDGDGTDDAAGYGLAVVTNVYAGYANRSVQLTVTNAAGEIATLRKDGCVRTGPGAVYVSLAGASVYPYADWASAATTIQAAVDIAVDGTTVFVSNGVYRATNDIILADGLSLLGVGGAARTIVDGRSSNRCFYLKHSRAVVDGFTLRNGKALSAGFPGGSGGGAFVECGGTLRHCVIASNAAMGAHVSGYGGGGVYCWQGGLVENSLFTGNTSAHDGGGVECWHGGVVRDCLLECNTAAIGGGGALCERGGLLESCTVVQNTAGQFGGGTHAWFDGDIRNCIVASNTAPDSEWASLRNAVEYPHTSAQRGYSRNCIPEGDPEDPLSDANYVEEPRFMSCAAGDFRLDTNSPCIDRGTNAAWMAEALDFEGKSRILGGIVDVGAYEFIPRSLDSDGDGIPDWWEWGWAQSMTNLGASADSDDDHFDNLQEFQAGTDPLDADSFLGLLMPTPAAGVTGLVVRWQSASNRTYQLERLTNLLDGAAETLAVSLPATPPANTFTDVTAVLTGPYVYRVSTAP